MSPFNYAAYNTWLEEIAASTMLNGVTSAWGPLYDNVRGILLTNEPQLYPEDHFLDAAVIETAVNGKIFHFYGRYFDFNQVISKVKLWEELGWYNREMKETMYTIFSFIEKGFVWNSDTQLPLSIRLNAGNEYEVKVERIASVIQQFTHVCDEKEADCILEGLDTLSVGSFDVDELENDFAPVEEPFDWQLDDDILNVWVEELLPDLVDEDPISVIDLTQDD